MSVAVRSSGNDVPPSEAAATLWMAAIDRLRKHIASLCDQRSAGQSPSSTAAEKDLIAPLLQEPRFAWLMQTFDLDALDGAILLIAAAGEIDPSIELLLASAASHPRHGGVSSVSCMGLLAIDAAQRVAMRRRFTAEHALFQHRLLLATARSAGDVDPWRRGQLSVDPQVLGMLLYEPGIDPRLARYCRLIEPVAESESTPLSRGQWQRLVTMADHTQATHRALHLQFHGNPGSGRRQTAEALANTLGLKLLVADVAQIAGAPEFAELLAPLFRQAWFSDALLYIEGVQTLSANVELERLLDATSEDSGITVLATPLQWHCGAHRKLVLTAIDFSSVELARRRVLWNRGLGGRQIAGADVALIAERFRLSPAQIDSAIEHAARRCAGRGHAGNFTSEDLIAAARAQAPLDLAQLARKVQPAASWDDLVLPHDAQCQLRELCARVTRRTRVLDEWGFDAKLSLGKGTSALFAGASGTGKTMAAEIVADELKLDLYKIDLAGVVSKYIGETEKNLDKVFTAARNANAVLLFDEADAIFGKRSEVRDSHDRYANLEISYLLQKMEEYEGLAILSTNLKQNLDDAFLRRLTYTVLFPFPDAADRERIWRRIWPPATPLEDGIDFGALAQRFKLAGGNIKNAALAAAYFAADEGCKVGMQHLVHGVRRELQKVGKALEEIEIAGLIPRTAAARQEARVG